MYLESTKSSADVHQGLIMHPISHYSIHFLHPRSQLWGPWGLDLSKIFPSQADILHFMCVWRNIISLCEQKCLDIVINPPINASIRLMWEHIPGGRTVNTSEQILCRPYGHIDPPNKTCLFLSDRRPHFCHMIVGGNNEGLPAVRNILVSIWCNKVTMCWYIN